MSKEKTVPVQKNSITSFRQETQWYSHSHKTLFLISPGWPNPGHVGGAKHRSEVSSDEIPEPAQSTLLTHNYILSLLIFNLHAPDQSKMTALLLLYHLRTSTRTDTLTHVYLICRPEGFWVNQSKADLWLIRDDGMRSYPVWATKKTETETQHLPQLFNQLDFSLLKCSNIQYGSCLLYTLLIEIQSYGQGWAPGYGLVCMNVEPLWIITFCPEKF